MSDKNRQKLTDQPFKALITALFIGSVFYVNTAYADVVTVPTLDQLMANLSNNIPQLMSLVTSFAYIMGMYLIIMGVVELKHFGESRTMMSSEHGLKKPLIFIFVGAALMFLPSSIQTGISTLWDQQNVPYGYVVTADDPWSALFGNCFLILQFIGVIAFIRGLITLTHLGGHGGQPGTFARGITYIIGGILCINMYDAVQMVFATFGMSTTFIGGGN